MAWYHFDTWVLNPYHSVVHTLAESTQLARLDQPSQRIRSMCKCYSPPSYLLETFLKCPMAHKQCGQASQPKQKTRRFGRSYIRIELDV